MRLNTLNLRTYAMPRTHEGAPAAAITHEQALRRSVLSCMLWEGEFYEDASLNWCRALLQSELLRWQSRPASV